MFGTLRYILACLVVVAHVGPLPLKHMGYYAVLCFFCLSGYILSRAYVRDYEKTDHGYVRYYANRLLRVFPTYLMTLAVTVALVATAPETARYIHPLSQMPGSTGVWLANIVPVNAHTLTGYLPQAMLIPPAWSLGVELVYWLLLPVVIRYPFLLLPWLGASLLATLYAYALKAGLELRYFSLLSGALPFAVGAALCRLQPERFVQHTLALLLILPGILYYVGSHALVADPFYWGLFGAIAFNALLVAGCAGLKASPCLQQIDDKLGQLAYPLFLLHIPVAICLSLLIGQNAGSRTWPFLFVCIIATTLAAWMNWRLIEAPINRWRARVRKSF